MAKLATIKRDSFKRGDTACFRYDFTEPYAGFDWSAITIDCALTSVEAPNDNTGAAAVRTAQSLTVNADNSATYLFQLTTAEAAYSCRAQRIPMNAN
jgi:hypothetical protein